MDVDGPAQSSKPMSVGNRCEPDGTSDWNTRLTLAVANASHIPNEDSSLPSPAVPAEQQSPPHRRHQHTSGLNITDQLAGRSAPLPSGGTHVLRRSAPQSRAQTDTMYNERGLARDGGAPLNMGEAIGPHASASGQPDTLQTNPPSLKLRRKSRSSPDSTYSFGHCLGPSSRGPMSTRRVIKLIGTQMTTCRK